MCGNNIVTYKEQLIVISTLFTVFFVLISTPWDFGNTFFGDNLEAWWIHYLIGIVLAFYTMWAFLRAIIMLMSHERHHIEGCNG
ncbi:MAG: hypothetical protein PHC38_03865 [Weeksellaceae bacterium]|nr:hypothetical protein [Weeksellaceae bacterium]